MLDGILNGIFLSLVNLQNIKKVNSMIGTAIVGRSLMKRETQKVKLENYL
jgi:hypothetical protein